MMRALLRAAGSLALAVALSGCGPDEDDRRPAGERPDLVVYLIDTLRADHLGCYGYPRDLTPEIDEDLQKRLEALGYV